MRKRGYLLMEKFGFKQVSDQRIVLKNVTQEIGNILGLSSYLPKFDVCLYQSVTKKFIEARGDIYHTSSKSDDQVTHLYRLFQESKLLRHRAYPESLLFQGFVKCHTNKMLDIDYQIIDIKQTSGVVFSEFMNIDIVQGLLNRMIGLNTIQKEVLEHRVFLWTCMDQSGLKRHMVVDQTVEGLTNLVKEEIQKNKHIKPSSISNLSILHKKGVSFDVVKFLISQDAMLVFADFLSEYSSPNRITNVVLYFPHQEKVINIDYQDIDEWVKLNKRIQYDYQIEENYEYLNRHVTFSTPLFSHFYPYDKVTEWFDFESDLEHGIQVEDIEFEQDKDAIYTISVYVQGIDAPLIYTTSDVTLNTGDKVVVPFGSYDDKYIAVVVKEPFIMTSDEKAELKFQVKSIIGRFIEHE